MCVYVHLFMYIDELGKKKKKHSEERRFLKFPIMVQDKCRQRQAAAACDALGSRGPGRCDEVGIC